MNNFEYIKWEDAYSVGNEKIDSEHRNLFNIAKEIYNCNNDHNKIFEIIKELIKYTKIHFVNEESFMKSIKYDGLEEHKNIHKQIVKQLNEIIKNTPNDTIDIIVKKVSDFTFKILLEHILTVDKKVIHLTRDRRELKKHFSWKSYYKIGNDLIDNEHKKLFDIATKAIDYEGTDIRLHIKETIKELYEYMHTHFKDEEEYMKSIGYYGLYDHSILHDKIIEDMTTFIKNIPSMKIEVFERTLIEYMDIWLINHILFEDRKILTK